jgi:hypothetical protein
LRKWSQWPGLNRRPTVYETVALPLSYIGLSLSTNPHVLNVPYFGRVKVNGKPIRHLPDTLRKLKNVCVETNGTGWLEIRAWLRPAGIANELAADAKAGTMCSVGTQRMESSPAACAEGWLSG